MASLHRFLFVLFVVVLAAPAGAQEPAAARKQSQPTLDPDAVRLPSSAYDTTKPMSRRAATPAPEGVKPGQFDLGDSLLQLDTKRQQPDSRVGIEAVDPKRLGGISKDNSSPLPSYLGLTLTKPLN